MKKWMVLLLAALLFNAAHAGRALADNVILATDEWCPYSCTPGSSSPGLLIEIASRALGQFGHTVEYRLAGWDKAVHLARDGKVDGLGGCSREEAEGFIFPIIPLGSAQVVIFGVRNSTWIYTGPESLKGKRIGVVAGYDYGKEAAVFLENPEKYEIEISASSAAHPLRKNLSSIAKEELDGIIGTRDVIRYVAEQMGMLSAVREAGVLGKPIPLYIPFSPAAPNAQKLADELDAGVRQMKDSGEIARILWKYGVLN